MARAFVVAIVGAESTGKTSLAIELGRALAAEGRSVAVVSEYLREFCDRLGRTPHCSEQLRISQEQRRRIDTAAASHDVVIADTTDLMTAVYSELLFHDTSLHPLAGQTHRQAGLTLLTALDLPWQPDGLQREGPHVREPVDALVRHALQRAGVPYAIVSGQGPLRLAAALLAVRHAMLAPSPDDEAAANPRWQWVCDRCGDVDCERHLLPRIN